MCCAHQLAAAALRACDQLAGDGVQFAGTDLAQRLHVLDLCKMFGWTSTTRALAYYNPRAVDIAQRITAAAPTRSPH